MNRRRWANRSMRGLGESIERLAQANIALILVQAVIIRISFEIADERADEPDPLPLIGFLAACVVAGAIVLLLARTIRRFPRRWQRITIALCTVVIQAAAFQLIHAYAS